MMVSLDISGAAMCPAGTAVITSQVKATLTFVGSRCAARAIEPAPTAAATPLAGRNRHLLWTGPREEGQFRIRSETYASCTDGRTYRVADLPVSPPGDGVLLASTTGGGGVRESVCRWAAACGAAVVVVCGGVAGEAAPGAAGALSGAANDAARCCAKIVEDRRRLENQACNRQRASQISERVGNAANGAAEAVGTVVLAIIGGALWIFTGGQWVPSY